MANEYMIPRTHGNMATPLGKKKKKKTSGICFHIKCFIAA